MADEHKTVILSIMGTLISALVIFAATVAITGGIDLTLVKAYVLPLMLSAFSLAIFAGVLVAHQKGKIPGMSPSEPEKDQKPADKPQGQGH